MDFKTILTSNITKVICVEGRDDKEKTVISCLDECCFPKKSEKNKNLKSRLLRTAANYDLRIEREEKDKIIFKKQDKRIIYYLIFIDFLSDPYK